MQQETKLIGLLFAATFLLNTIGNSQVYSSKEYLVYTVDPHHQKLAMYWVNEKGELFGSFRNLNTWLESKNKRLVFAMNGGMYRVDRSPVGLFIDSFRVRRNVNKASASGNFYLKPNGVFYITRQGRAGVTESMAFHLSKDIQYATQSGPMLLVDGKIHPSFTEHSSNVNIRNGVGILPDGRVIFVMSKIAVNFFDFARYFQSWGCKNALYLDGFVSKVYLPAAEWYQAGGNFGVIIAETTDK